MELVVAGGGGCMHQALSSACRKGNVHVSNLCSLWCNFSIDACRCLRVYQKICIRLVHVAVQIYKYVN